MEYIIFETGWGWVGILGSWEGLLAVTLPRSSEQEVHSELGAESATLSPGGFTSLAERLQDYYAGIQVEFPDELDLSMFTSFQSSVWQAARLIPYGETRSYGWLAEKVGKPGGARAVGQALGRNPFLVIVPCHRVVAGDGGLGGFGGGLEMKRRLLEMEGNKIPLIPL